MTETQLTNPIKKFSQQSNGTTYVGNFGADADNIQITLTDGQNPPEIILQTNLLDFFKNWQDFKETNAFMYHGDISIEDMDNLDQQVKFLYRFDNLKYKLFQEYPNAVDISKYSFEGRVISNQRYVITRRGKNSSNIITPERGLFACLIQNLENDPVYLVFDFSQEASNINDYIEFGFKLNGSNYLIDARRRVDGVYNTFITSLVDIID